MQTHYQERNPRHRVGQTRADVWIEDETIQAVGTRRSRSIPGDKESTPRGATCIPGGIDVHTHLDMPFMGATT